MSSLRDLQLVDLALFKKFVKFAEENNIKYFALGGTLLGAIRHKGFIPWDDDMDIGIPREDYDRFIELCGQKNPEFELHTFSNDPDYYRYFSRIEDPSIKLKRHDNEIEEISSAWIDVFPLDGMPNNSLLRKMHKEYLLYRRAMYRLSVFHKAVNLHKKNRPLSERMIIKFGKIVPMDKILNTQKELHKLDKALKRVPYSKSNYLVNAMGAYKFNEMFNKSVYGNGKAYPFEDTTIWGPDDYDFVCRQLYGDYMTPVNDNHHESNIM